MEPAPAMAAVMSGPRSPGLVSSGNCLPPGWMFFRLPPAPADGPALTRAQNILIGMAQTGVLPVTSGAHNGG
jgi:hypothetical protein